jgi:hypothetical protein
MDFSAIRQVDFDIDRYINQIVPRPQLHRLPRPISRFLGYRDKPRKNGSILINWAWSFIGGFSGVALIEGVSRGSTIIQSLRPPIIIGSFVRFPSAFRC